MPEQNPVDAGAIQTGLVLTVYIVKDNGEFMHVLQVSDPSVIDLLVPPGAHAVDVAPPEGSAAYWDFEMHAWVPKPPQPKPYDVWNADTHNWFDPRSFADVKAAKKVELNKARKAASLKTFTYSGHEFDCDADSRREMDAVTNIIALTGALPAGWSGSWQDSNNIDFAVPTKAVWMAMQQALFQQLKANFAKVKSLKTQLGSATTNAQIDAIVW